MDPTIFRSVTHDSIRRCPNTGQRFEAESSLHTNVFLRTLDYARVRNLAVESNVFCKV